MCKLVHSIIHVCQSTVGVGSLCVTTAQFVGTTLPRVHAVCPFALFVFSDGSSGPMSPWNDAALVSLRERLKLNVSMNTGLSDRLEKAAGGFMSEHEAKMVREPTTASNMEKIEKIIEILRGKTNEDFATFCTMLRETNHVVWADELEKEAERFKRERKGS